LKGAFVQAFYNCFTYHDIIMVQLPLIFQHINSVLTGIATYNYPI